MSKIWEPQPLEVYTNWINTILTEASDELNNWETKFIESIATRLITGIILTQFQAEKLEQIYAEKTK